MSSSALPTEAPFAPAAATADEILAAPSAPEADVGRRVFRQTTAYAVLRSTSGLVTWAAFVALSRILDRRSFGAFEIGMFYVGLGQVIGDGGFAASLVRRKGRVRRIEYQTALTSVLAMALVMALGLMLFASWLGRINQLTSREIWALRVLAPLYLVPALRLVPYAELERAIDFARIGKVELAANLVRHVTAVTVALAGGGVWALALSQLALAATQTILAYRAVPGWVGLGWSARAFRSLFAYGSKIQASIFLIHVKQNLAGGLLGPWLGPSAVGVFRFGLEFVQVPSDTVSSLARVQFPVYAQLSRTSPELGKVLRQTLRAALLLGLPVLGVLVLGAPWMVPFVYGDKWRPALPVVAALVPHVGADLLAYHLITFVQGRGRAGLALWIYGLWSGGLWLLSALAIWLGGGSLVWVGGAYGAATVVSVAVLVFWAGRYLGVPLYRDLLVPLIAAAAGFGAAEAISLRLPCAPALRAAVGILTFLAAFASIAFAFERRTLVGELRRSIAALRNHP